MENLEVNMEEELEEKEEDYGEELEVREEDGTIREGWNNKYKDQSFINNKFANLLQFHKIN
jgi:hypothetical protein